MKRILGCILAAILISLNVMAQPVKKELRHVVLFGWKAGADTAEIKRVVAAFKELPGQIKTIKHFEWGVNNSPENLNQGLTHCFFVTFSSEKDRDDYLVHPAHKAFTQLLPNILEKVTVLDYWAQP
ncbi:MAG: Dabb family protein [Williamsia sp.]|nr:Dabb family protein [Williamsia sp.]